MRARLSCAWLLAALLPACGGGDGDDADDDDGGGRYEVGAGALTGTVGGESWTLVSGTTDAFLSEGEPEYWADLYAVQSDCGSFPPSGNSIIASIPRAPGRYPLSLSLNATFVIDGPTIDNLIATKGVIEVDTVSSSAIVGGAHIEFDSTNVVNGRFTIEICP
jgi:hypothetical protein